MGEFFGLGPTEVLVLGVIAVLLFGKNLPEVGRKAGKYLSQFRRSVQNIQHEINAATSEINSEMGANSSPSSEDCLDREETTAPKFEPPPG
ncbi:MAG: twin-arginine translocase TatA/TatE family subunit [Pirellulales bacterium]|nr:twin-arginine translocase TatA/TatE family subunit [Pirellulales bacterium]